MLFIHLIGCLFESNLQKYRFDDKRTICSYQLVSNISYKNFID